MIKFFSTVQRKMLRAWAWSIVIQHNNVLFEIEDQRSEMSYRHSMVMNKVNYLTRNDSYARSLLREIDEECGDFELHAEADMNRYIRARAIRAFL